MDQDTAASKTVYSFKAVSEIFVEQKCSKYHYWGKWKGHWGGHWVECHDSEVLMISQYELLHLHNAIKATFLSALL